jgi:hypothetical protein
MFGYMKYRPSKSFVYLMVALCPITVALIFGLLPELPSFAARPIPGDISFSSEKPVFQAVKPVSFKGSHSIHPSEWLEEGYENLMKWEYNPWKIKPESFGNHYLKLRDSKDPSDQTKVKELKRLSEAWYARLLLRYPEMAVAMKHVPDDQNGFLKWLEFSERFKQANGGNLATLAYPHELDQYLNHDGPWNTEVAKAWLTAQKPLLDEVLAIGLLPDASVNGIDLDRWAFIPARLAKSCAEGLMIEARLAAEQGDAEAAIQSVRAATGLADHFTEVETPSLLGATIQILLHLKLENLALTELMPALPEGKLDPQAWENALKPTVSQPAEFARLMKGEWSITNRQYLLPMLMDTEDPKNPPDGGDLLDTYTALFSEIVRTHEGASIEDLTKLEVPWDLPDVSHLSRSSKEAVSIVFIGANAWRKGWDRSISMSAMTQAAFAIMKGQPIPQDPVYQQDYRWDPATRQLSMPAGKNFDDLAIKPITVPKL